MDPHHVDADPDPWISGKTAPDPALGKRFLLIIFPLLGIAQFIFPFS